MIKDNNIYTFLFVILCFIGVSEGIGAAIWALLISLAITWLITVIRK